MSGGENHFFHGDFSITWEERHRPAKYPQGEGLSSTIKFFEETFGTFPLQWAAEAAPTPPDGWVVG